MRRLGTLGVVLIPYALLVAIGLGLGVIERTETLIKWEPTIRFWLAAALLGAPFYLGFNIFERLLAKVCPAPHQWWRTLMLTWLWLLLALGAANLVGAYTLSTDGWVNLKLFGLAGGFWLAGLILLFLHYRQPHDVRTRAQA